ncbi:MAG: lipopolysaccharide biosynthesis protein [Gammaproteobacteria bacterium]
MDVTAKVVTALRWTAAARFLGQLISWAITIIVIRILTPADYGLMAMAIVLMNLLYLINTIGLDSALIQKKDITEHMRRQVFGIVIFLNLAFFLGLFLGAPLIAAFFEEPALIPVVRTLSVQFILYVFEVLPQTKLERELSFKNRSIVDLATMVMGSVVTLGLALTGAGVWALVYGHLVTVATRMLGLNIIAPCLLWPSFSLQGMRENFAYGGFVAIDKTLWFIFAESDKFIGGKLLGKELLGVYAVANHLAALPINKIAGLIIAVAFPAFSQVQSEPKKVRHYLLRAASIMSVVAFPVFFGMSSVAPELVATLLGEKWTPAALPLLILGLVMPLRMISTLLPPVLWGVGRPGVSAGNFLIAAIVMPIAFFVGAQWGPAGMAMSWLLAYPFVFLISVWRTVTVTKLGLMEFLATMFRPTLACAGMYAAVAATRLFALNPANGMLNLVILTLVGAATYTALLFLIHREGLREAIALAKR